MASCAGHYLELMMTMRIMIELARRWWNFRQFIEERKSSRQMSYFGQDDLHSPEHITTGTSSFFPSANTSPIVFVALLLWPLL